MFKKVSLGLVLVVGIVAAWFIIPQMVRANHPQDAAVITSIAVAKVRRTNLAQAVDFDAEFRPYQEIDLHAKVAGFVKEMLVDIGDRVQTSQLLATLEVPELQADIQRAAVTYDAADLTYNRLLTANKAQPNLIAQQDLDDARAKDQLTKADVAKLSAMLAYTQITAPFAGVITKREADPGALIPGGTANSQTMPLLRLSENDRLRLTFPVSVSYVARIKVGQPVRIHIQATGQTLSGMVSRFTRKVDTATRTMDVEVDVPNPDFSLVPGMYASVTVELERRDKTLAVPMAAVARQEKATVYVVTLQNEIQERIVTLGLETPELIEVVNGLNEGDLVMIGSRTKVQPGQKVEAKIIEPVEAQ